MSEVEENKTIFKDLINSSPDPDIVEFLVILTFESFGLQAPTGLNLLRNSFENTE